MLIDGEDVPVLSGDALAALQNFYVERDNDLEVFNELRYSTGHGLNTKPLSMSMFREDWNASQFWFTDKTAEFLARQLLLNVTSGTSIAIVSAPSVFVQIRNLLSLGKYPPPARLCLFEYDERFELLDGYVKYDFNRPTEMPADMKGGFDRILCDPPYHSEACVLQYAGIVKWLARETGGEISNDQSLRIVCTGETMQDVVSNSLIGVRMTSFRPQHTVRLDNRYACFANVELGST